MVAVSYSNILKDDFIAIYIIDNIGNKMEETLTIKIGLYKVPEGYWVNEGAFKL